jgi:hypothetical protein
MSKIRKVHYFVASLLVLFGLATSAQARKKNRLSAPNIQVQISAALNLRQISIKMPQSYGQIIGASNRYRQGIGYGCEPGEVVKTCDANISAVMPPSDFLWGSKMVLGTASNPALLGIRIKTKCTARVERDNSSRFGCVYEGCFGYSKSITMVCMKQ